MTGLNGRFEDGFKGELNEGLNEGLKEELSWGCRGLNWELNEGVLIPRGCGGLKAGKGC
jgi:hypothetical protein